MHSVATVSLRRAALAAGFAAAVALVAPADATIFKCDSPDGTPVYQDSPCPAGKELRDFDKDPPTVSVLPLAPAPAAGPRDAAPAKAPAADKARAVPKEKASSTATQATSASAGNAAERKFLAPGINEGQVLARLGPPDMKSGGGTRKTARWTYLPAPGDPGTLTTLTFESGRLIEVERKVVR